MRSDYASMVSRNYSFPLKGRRRNAAHAFA